MIDLNYVPKNRDKAWEPEEIACAIIAIVIWAVIILGIVRAL